MVIEPAQCGGVRGRYYPIGTPPSAPRAKTKLLKRQDAADCEWMQALAVESEPRLPAWSRQGGREPL